LKLEGETSSILTVVVSTTPTATLNSAGIAGKVVQIDVGYGTDAAEVGRGFWFDKVTVTDIELLVPDVQIDTCGCTLDAECDDGVSCTVDTCNLIDGTCGSVADDSICDNGDFCDGSETCHVVLDCQTGSAPCIPGIETCNEGTDICDPTACTVDSQCDDGDFCTGAETCNVGLGFCEAGTPPSDPVLSGITITGPATHQACGTLTVGPSVTFDGGLVTLRAGNRVTFIPPVTTKGALEVENGPPVP
jgi:hypothetical protein